MNPIQKYLSTHNISIIEAAFRLQITEWYMKTLFYGNAYPSIELAQRIEELTHGEVKASDIINPKKKVETCETCGCKLKKNKKIA